MINQGLSRVSVSKRDEYQHIDNDGYGTTFSFLEVRVNIVVLSRTFCRRMENYAKPNASTALAFLLKMLEKKCFITMNIVYGPCCCCWGHLAQETDAFVHSKHGKGKLEQNPLYFHLLRLLITLFRQIFFSEHA